MSGVGKASESMLDWAARAVAAARDERRGSRDKSATLEQLEQIGKLTRWATNYIEHPLYAEGWDAVKVHIVPLNNKGYDFQTLMELGRTRKEGRRTPWTIEEERSAFLEYNWHRRVVAETLLRCAASGSDCMSAKDADVVIESAKRYVTLMNRITEINLGLVVHLYCKIKARMSGVSTRKEATYLDIYGTKVNAEEVMSILGECLARCVMGFDVSRGFRFSTYAHRASMNEWASVLERMKSKTTGARIVRDKLRNEMQVAGYMIQSKQSAKRQAETHEEQIKDATEYVRAVALGEIGLDVLSDKERAVVQVEYRLGSYAAPGRRGDRIIALGFKTRQRFEQVLAVALKKIRRSMPGTIVPKAWAHQLEAEVGAIDDEGGKEDAR